MAASKQQDLYDSKGNRIGRVITGDRGAQDLYDQKGNRLGRYEPVSDRTLDGRPSCLAGLSTPSRPARKIQSWLVVRPRLHYCRVVSG